MTSWIICCDGLPCKGDCINWYHTYSKEKHINVDAFSGSSKVMNEMTLVIESEQEKLEFDSLPEYVRDSELLTPRESILNRSSESSYATGDRPRPIITERDFTAPEGEAPSTDELEALWPGVHHELIQPPKRNASFYMTIGFMAGAFVSLIGVWGYSAVSGMIVASANNNNGNKQILVAANKAPAAAAATAAPAQTSGNADPSAELVPASPTYEVQNGDTLAMIALKNYKRVSPRLLDEICKANGMRNANVLSLGQRLSLPTYRPQSSQIAATNTTIQ